MTETDTIAAPATPHGKSALAIVRVSGSNAFKITARCIKEKILFEKTPARYIRLFIVKDPISGKTIDQITGIKYFSPQSFTGEDMVEIICHGGQLIIKEIFNALINAGAQAAIGGEFTRRALYNGKVDIMKAEAIHGLIESNSETDLRCALKLYRGTTHNLELWRKELIDLLGWIEAQIEFEETDKGTVTASDGKKRIENFILRLKKEIEKREKIQIIENGIKVVIAGPVNAGKSTLFNTLIGKNRTIVHREPGTTRDIISERLLLCDHDIQLIDSAGIRKTDNEIEREGVVRSREAMKGASLIIWVTAADEKLNQEELLELIAIRGNKNSLCVINKIDKEDGREKIAAIEKATIDAIAVSLKENKNTDKLISKIVKKIEEINSETEIPDILLNARYEEIGRAVYSEILLARDAWERPEIAAYHLKNGLSHMDEFFGKNNSEEIINKIFKDFCIGK